MAFFGSSNHHSVEETSSGKSGSVSATMITECLTITGDIKGCGTVHIDGTVEGDVEVEEGIVLGTSGHITGNITSRVITISGHVTGHIFGETVEVTQSGTVSNDIHAVNLTVDGNVEGFVQADEKIHVTQHGSVRSERMESQHIIVHGSVSGKVTATELLEINQNGRVEGEMTVKRIKVDEGGMMLGSMQTYQPEIHPSPLSFAREAEENSEEAAEAPDSFEA